MFWQIVYQEKHNDTHSVHIQSDNKQQKWTHSFILITPLDVIINWNY